jgi:ABC-type sugar transport system ATPase subunit
MVDNDKQAAPRSVPLIEARGLTVSFGAFLALRDVSLRLDQGRVYGLVGPNGAGKSTLVKVLTGLVEPDQGTLSFLGEPLSFGDSRLLSARGVSIVPQETSLIEDLSVEENINLGGELQAGPFLRRAAMVDRSVELLARVGLDVSPRAPIRSLSTSQRRLVMVAKALRSDLRLLILDEPTAAMSAAEASVVLDAVRRLRASGVTTVLITHRFDEVLDVCDAVIAVRDGEVVRTWDDDRATLRELVDVVTGEVDQQLGGTIGALAMSTIALRAFGLRGSYLKPVDFELRHGEIVGVIGRPGSGAQEFLSVLAGVHPKHHARLEIEGETYAIRSPAQALRARIGYLPEDRAEAGLPEMSVRENVMLSSLRSVAGRAFFIDRERERQLTALNVPVRLQDRTAEPFRNLSGGNRQLVLIGRLVAAGTRIFVLSNPSVGVDVRGREDLRVKIHDLAADGRSVVIFSSEPAELMGLAHRVLIIDGGEIRDTIQGDEITEANLLAGALMAVSGAGQATA